MGARRVRSTPSGSQAIWCGVDPENPVEAASDAGDSVGAESAAPLAEAGAPAADSPEGSVPRLSASVVQAQENQAGQPG